ncbi:MAG: NPCBM/NEW2 domain-containing protein, partial [Limisphaerales bacterium]
RTLVGEIGIGGIRADEIMSKLHLPRPEQTVNRETLRYFMQKAVDALKAGRTGDAARYMGTICHLIEDFGSPSHTVPGDNMFTLLQQFMPPTPVMEGKLMHGPIEKGDFAVSIADYQPRLLGTSVEQASWLLLHRVHEAIINARSTTVPIMRALYADDRAAVVKHQLRAATKDAQVVADAMHTIVCLGSARFDKKARAQCERVSIARFWPVEAVNLFYPQSHFFSAPFWGHASSNVVMEKGTKAMPIKLRVAGKDGDVSEKLFAEGISTGMGKALTFHLPKGVYRRFTSAAGLQSGIGDKGRVEFTVLGDGKPLVNAIVGGSEPARNIACDIGGVAHLQLKVVSRGPDAKSNYAVWAEPVLAK